MSLINIKNLTFSYGTAGENIFENTNLQIDTDWKLGLVGRNGKGKTTLLNLFLKKYEYSGKIEHSVNFEYFPFAVQDESWLVCDIAGSVLPDLEQWRLKKELNLLGADDEILYRSFNTLSKGEQTKALIALLFLKHDAFLLIDEPTNHLDGEARQILSEYLSKKSGYILVSHDRTFLDNCTDHILSINRSNIELQRGNFSSYLQNKEMQDRFEEGENSRLKTEIGRLKSASLAVRDHADKAEGAKFGGKQASGLRPDRGRIGAKAARVMKSAKVIESHCARGIQEKSKLLKNTEKQDPLKMDVGDMKNKRIATINNLSVCYDGRPIISNLSFEIMAGDRLAIVGKNGSGKTTILKAILNQIADYEGEVRLASKLKISYVSQDTSFLHGSLEDFCAGGGIAKTELLTMLTKLGFSKTQFEKSIEEFSEGQKKKLLIAKSLCANAELYVWDEPLNYIDIMSRKQIEDMILLSAPTMIFVEHDKYFCDCIASKKIEL